MKVSRWPLRVMAPLLLCLPVLIAVGVLSLIAFVHARQAANQLALAQLQEIHHRIDARLTELLSVPQRINQINAQMIRDGRLDDDDLRSWRDFLYEQATAFEMLSGILWASEQGEVVWMFRYPGKPGYEFGIKDDATGNDVHEYRMLARNDISAAPVGQYEFDPRNRPWYADARESGRRTWTEYAWVNEDGSEVTYGLANPEPFYDSAGDLLGVLDAEISLHDVSRFLASLQVGRHGLAFLIDRRGNLLATSAGVAVHDEQLNRIPARNCSNPLIAQAAADLDSRFESLSDVGRVEPALIDMDGQPHLMTVSPISEQTGLEWLTVTIAPESDFLAGVYTLGRRSLYFALAAVLATLLIGLVSASALVRPILRLVEHVRQIGEGHLDRKLQLNGSREFTQLSDEINTMTEGLRDRMRLRHSLALAMEVQQSLLPSTNPRIEGLDIAGHSTYCDETGGDYYDFLDVAGVSDDSLAIALGDVMGHGVAAAMLMATARGVLRSRCRTEGSLGEFLNHLNQLLVEDTGGERFMTLLLLTINMRRRELRWSSAGHDPPLIYDPERSDFVPVDEDGGFPLGLFDEDGYPEQSYQYLRSGQILVIATDGLWETRNRQNEQFGKLRLRDLVHANAQRTAAEISDQIQQQVDAFRGGPNPDDDVTFVIAKIE